MSEKSKVSVPGMLLGLAALILAAATGSFAAVLAVFLAAALVGLSAAANLQIRNRAAVEIRLPVSATKQNVVSGLAAFQNDSALPIGRMRCRIEIKNTFTGEIFYFFVSSSVAPKKKKNVPFTLQSEHCGYLTVSVRETFLTDVFGLFGVPVSCGGTALMTVTPQTFSPDVTLIPRMAEDDDCDTYSPNKKGNDFSEPFQIREYAEGDSIRQIHWKLSSKTDRIIVRDPSLPITRSLLVFWDKSADDKASAGTMDAMAEAVVSICQRLTEMGLLYVLSWNETQTGQCIEKEVDGEEQLLELVPQMLKNGTEAGALSGLSAYLQRYGRFRYGKVIYLTAAVPPEWSEIENMSDITMLLCTDRPAMPGGNRVVFSPQDYMRQLQVLEL